MKLVLIPHLRIKREVMVVASGHRSFLKQYENLADRLEDKIKPSQAAQKFKAFKRKRRTSEEAKASHCMKDN